MYKNALFRTSIVLGIILVFVGASVLPTISSMNTAVQKSELKGINEGSAPTTFTDRVWIVGARGCPGQLVQVEVWLEFEGVDPDDMISGFDILLAWNNSAGTVETITIGPEFAASYWLDQSRADNEGTQGPPPVPKMDVSAFVTGPLGLFVPRGVHLAGTIGFRIRETATIGDSTCFEALETAFDPIIYFQFANKRGYSVIPSSFSTDCVQVVEYVCGDFNGDERITSADGIYLCTYIYKNGLPPLDVSRGDVNLDGRVTVADALYIFNYIYRGGRAPCEPI